MNFHISASQIITEGFWEEGGVVWWCQKNVGFLQKIQNGDCMGDEWGGLDGDTIIKHFRALK